MSRQERAAAELEALREICPGWEFRHDWVAAGSGPDCRIVVGERDGRTLAALDGQALAAKIGRER